jgi:glutathione S-transferase
VPARLVTIPISHFCEKARWALDRAGIDYVEERHVQLIHVAAAHRAGGGRTVPVLVTEDGTVLRESSEIVRWADPALYDGAEVAALEARFDEGLGPDGRLWMYHQTLPVVEDLGRWALAGVPRWERAAFRVSGRLVDVLIRRYLGVDAPRAQAALGRVEREFDEVAGRLSDGRRYLLGDRFTAADLAFGALTAPLLLPERYGSPLPAPEAVPGVYADVVARCRAHPAGAFALRLYEEDRQRP